MIYTVLLQPHKTLDITVAISKLLMLRGIETWAHLWTAGICIHLNGLSYRNVVIEMRRHGWRRLFLAVLLSILSLAVLLPTWSTGILFPTWSTGVLISGIISICSRSGWWTR